MHVEGVLIWTLDIPTVSHYFATQPKVCAPTTQYPDEFVQDSRKFVGSTAHTTISYSSTNTFFPFIPTISDSSKNVPLYSIADLTTNEFKGILLAHIDTHGED